MGLYGNLSTMSVGELLAWVDGGGKSGTLEVERDKIVKRITFEQGRVASCSSNDPTTLMGQFLLSSGRITREMLSRAMSLQGSRQANLGQILLEMGAIAQPDREAFVQAKIEETIFGLFDWDDAVFRFYTDALIDPNAVEARLEIDEILRRGRQRSAERKLSGRALNDPRIVLGRTGELPPPELSASRSARRIFDLIDGKKTVAEIVLHSHAPEFLVTKFLTALLHGKVVEINGLRPAPAAEIEPARSAPPATPAEELDPRDESGPLSVPVAEAGSAREPAGPSERAESGTSAPDAPSVAIEPPEPPPPAPARTESTRAAEPAPASASPPARIDPLDLVPDEAWGPSEDEPDPPRPASAGDPRHLDEEATDAAPDAPVDHAVAAAPTSAPAWAIDVPAVAPPTRAVDPLDVVPAAADPPGPSRAHDSRPPSADTPVWLDELDDCIEPAGPPDPHPQPLPEAGSAPSEAATDRRYRLLPQQPSEVSRELEQEINVALQLMASGQPEAALELLNAMAAAHPADTALRQLVVNAEQDFCKKMLQGELEASSVPTRGTAVAPEGLSAEESFLLEQIDGHTDVQALLWVAPMRDVDALKTLYRMLRKGWLELRRAA